MRCAPSRTPRRHSQHWRTKFRRRITGATAAVVLVVASGCGPATTGSSFEFASPGGQTKIFYDPPEQRGAVQLSGESLTEPGRELSLSQYAGKVVVLNVWGSWCGPCRTEADDLETVYAKTKDSGVQFLGVNVRDDRSAAQDFMTNFKVSYPSLYDPAGRSLLALKGFPRSVVPATIILDRKHRVAAVFLTALLESDLLPVVQRIAAEQPAASSPTTGGRP
ncbi:MULTISPECIES: TlpA disulfide reductase family protein [Saccharomonospora]|jgi:thiol-disulfide isomerase/thioredoxin|uniref:Thiol-disulfide isomerase-like thioredoxin n=3 Tax=Saccharomonospora TaxID=1851 RepID=I1D4J7_9PSEU|nr:MULTISPECIES: TlpA disulfide reductase family protein [Saccharomonospora]EHR61520.1 thiol-disulfide isomerase-like thioredoxin [Saccharomonospora cyanea NA-134]EHY87422.1 thiol-disulfide isomerase-like thioredoxin [Saccharomonospora azurea NA-128]EIE99871.1 thiol-disulfide isomerase-like thioredoxin [Saccharomonospora glauca K62]